MLGGVFRQGKFLKMRRQCCIWAVLLGLAASARANSWADALFDEPSYDFGAVPRGQIVTHPFRVVNKTDKTVQIGNVRVSCGMCSSAYAAQSTLEPGQETVILTQMYTSRFASVKEITVYVQFLQPKFEEVRLNIKANSRDDLSYNPESLSFGKIKRGAGAAQSMTITFYGMPTKILDAKSESNYVQLSCKEAKGTSGDSSYQIEAKIRSDTPAGKWYTDIWLNTNNPSMPKLRVPLTVEVEASLSVSPKAVALGEIKAGGETDRKVILRSANPFRITSISGTDNILQVREGKAESKNVHVLTVTLRPSAVGQLERTIRVQTDLKNGGDIEFQAQANVVP